MKPRLIMWLTGYGHRHRCRACHKQVGEGTRIFDSVCPSCGNYADSRWDYDHEISRVGIAFWPRPRIVYDVKD